MLPQNHSPKTPGDFIGPARPIAEFIDKIVERVIPAGDPVKLFFYGLPGVGKSELANYFARRIGVDRWHQHKFNGTQVRVDVLEDLWQSLHYKDMFGQYRIVRIDEVDKVPHAAQVRILTLLDDLPPHTAVLCTSNAHLDELEARFQSRFQAFEVKPPSAGEIQAFLERWEIPPATAAQIATFACGNVRQALMDAQTALLAA